MLRLLAVFVPSVFVLVAAPWSFGQAAKELKGVVQNVDDAVGTITLLVEGTAASKTERIKTFSLIKPDLPITDAAGKPLKLADLAAETRVYFRLQGEDVAAIRLAPPSLFGTLAKVDVPKRIVILSTRIGERTLHVPESAKISEQLQPLSLQELKPGSITFVLLADDQKSVVEIRVGKKLMPLTRLVKATGYLIDLDADKRTAQILTNASMGDYSLLRDLKLAKEASFALLYQGRPFREMTAAEIGRALRVHFWTEVNTRRIVHMEVEMPILGKRVVKAFDPQKRALVLEDIEGERRLVLSPRVKVMHDEQPGKLEDLRPNTQVICALGPDRKAVEYVQVFGK